MQPVTEQTLILLYYGELDRHDADAVRSVLAQDPDLAERFAQLSAELATLPEPEAPVRDDNYGRRVWARVDAVLDDRPRGASWLKLPFLPGNAFRFAGGVLVLGMVALIAFQAGRMTPPEPMQLVTTLPDNATPNTGYSAQLLEASLVNHFDSADRLLTEISNNPTADIDIESEKEWAKVLLVANRLYRFAAEQAGQRRIAQLLGDMEPVLVELANGAGQLTPDEYRVLRQSIAERNLVFKVRATNLALNRPESETL